MLVLLATLPNDAIKKHIQESAIYFVNEDSYAFTDDGIYQNITDNYADQIWTNIGWHMGIGNPFRSVLDTQYYDGEKYPISAGLYLAVTEENFFLGYRTLNREMKLMCDRHGIEIPFNQIVVHQAQN